MFDTVIAREKIQQALQQALEVLKVGSRWWTSELDGMIPPKIKEALRQQQDFVTVMLARDELIATIHTAQKTEHVHRWPLAEVEHIKAPPLELASFNGPVFVSLDPAEILVGGLKVPSTAAPKIRNVMAFEIQRSSPFKDRSVLYDFAVVGQDPQTKALKVEWALVAEDRAKRAEALTRKLGLKPSAIGLAEASSARLHYVFSRPSWRGALQLGPASIALGASLLFLVLSFLGAGLFHAQRASSLRSELQAIKSQAEGDQRVKFGVESRMKGLAFLRERLEEPALHDVLKDLTAATGDDSWIFGLELRGDTLFLKGVSKSTATLLEKWAAVPTLSNPRLNAPMVLRGGKDQENLEQFDIAVTIKGRYAGKGDKE